MQSKTQDDLIALERTYRLNKLIEILRRPEVKTHLDMHVWREEQEDCGTVCCALGWAALEPEFVDQGLTLKQSRDNFYYPVYNKVIVGSFAGECFFHISYRQSQHIFIPNSYAREEPITTEDVIKHIEEVLDEYRSR